MTDDASEKAVGRLAIGIDVGGSGIKAAVVDVDTGRLISERLRVPTPVPSTPDLIIASISRLVRRLVKDEAAKKIRLARNPTGRFGKPEEIVQMAVYLASDESRWTNGASLVVDGGITVNYF